MVNELKRYPEYETRIIGRRRSDGLHEDRQRIRIRNPDRFGGFQRNIRNLKPFVAPSRSQPCRSVPRRHADCTGQIDAFDPEIVTEFDIGRKLPLTVHFVEIPGEHRAPGDVQRKLFAEMIAQRPLEQVRIQIIGIERSALSGPPVIGDSDRKTADRITGRKIQFLETLPQAGRAPGSDGKSFISQSERRLNTRPRSYLIDPPPHISAHEVRSHVHHHSGLGF